MIPLQLILKNFLSYREANLDFRGLHTACICGANGAGKSSLLEGITWAIWGQTRATSEDDVIHAGANDVRVDFEFISNQITYRVIRTRSRGRNTNLEFQVRNESGFRSIGEKGVRATQQRIVVELKLDYDTFINSAYLRQGRADEFMLRRPNERKQILADLLKLDRYEELAERAKEISKEFKGQTEELESSLKPIEEQLQRTEAIAREREDLQTQLQQLQIAQGTEQEQLQALQAIEHQRRTWEQQVVWHQTQHQNTVKECDRLSREGLSLKTQLSELEKLLQQEPEILEKSEQLLRWQKEEEILASKLQVDRDARAQKQKLEKQLGEQLNELNLQIQQTQTRIEALEQQEQEIRQVLANSAEVKAGLEQLHLSRQRLSELDRLQTRVAPLLQRRAALQTEIERVKARLAAKLEQSLQSEREFSEQLEQVPQLRQKVLSVDALIGELDKKRVYQKRVEEKGIDKKNLQGILQENQRLCQEQLAELRQKLAKLQTPDALCPLCDRELDGHYRLLVIGKTQERHREIEEQLFHNKEQIADCERELHSLRAEYSQLTEDLKPYDSLQQQLGQLEGQLEATGDLLDRLQQIKQEIEMLESSLRTENYAEHLQLEFKQLEAELQLLDYDEQTHALVRGEAERWRWAEIKQAKIDDAKRRQAGIDAQKPHFRERVASLQASIQQLDRDSPLKQKIEELEHSIASLGYEPAYHNQILASVRQGQVWQLRERELKQAQQQYPQLQANLQHLEQLWQEQQKQKASIKEQLDRLLAQMERLGDNREGIRILEQNIARGRHQLDELFATQGRLDQQLYQLENLQTHYQNTCERVAALRKQCRIYQELANAFGKNGIQALMIENILPQLEAQTNAILARLTGNQFHVQFLTQKAGRSSSSKKESSKLIDTLEILIADARGTRPYETYSGGEAFRINFSIRLALAQLLAQRAGTALQMLIVDEGFGTQDSDGCDRLIGAINAISSDFSCILTVTHMPQFKEAFQTRIEVLKTERGSELNLIN